MDKGADKKKIKIGETSARSLKKRHSTYIISAHTESLRRHEQLRECD